MKYNQLMSTIREVVDLTYDLHEGMPTFHAPWHPLVSVTQMGRIGFEGRETRQISFGTHTGTQIDAPLHFVAGGETIDQLELRRLIGPVTILDLTALKENEAVEVSHLKRKKLYPRVICKFGWGEYWQSKKFYRNYPFFSAAAARYLIDQQVEVVGMDTPSPDDGRTVLTGDILGTSQDSPIHKIFLHQGVILLEYLAHLDLVTDYVGWTLIALPLKIRGADGSPARVCLVR